jgi:hypothetical protein
VAKLRILPPLRSRVGAWPITILYMAGILAGASVSGCAQEGKNAPANGSQHPVFSESDAARVMENLRQALESENPRRFLKLFDAKKMPGFATFRDQVSEFFETYGPIRVTYHLTQVTTETDFGAAMAEIRIEATPRRGTIASTRKTVPVRLVLGWDDKTWKIVDWSPRAFFQ